MLQAKRSSTTVMRTGHSTTSSAALPCATPTRTTTWRTLAQAKWSASGASWLIIVALLRLARSLRALRSSALCRHSSKCKRCARCARSTPCASTADLPSPASSAQDSSEGYTSRTCRATGIRTTGCGNRENPHTRSHSNGVSLPNGVFGATSNPSSVFGAACSDSAHRRQSHAASAGGGQSPLNSSPKPRFSGAWGTKPSRSRHNSQSNGGDLAERSMSNGPKTQPA
mmetsp:Transcript_36547/g.86497  ORF Transcript_36547/g.86497 Transcript_36547/m.86497 type:complete len:227 (+) Transcript_36547:595-1275(+)